MPLILYTAIIDGAITVSFIGHIYKPIRSNGVPKSLNQIMHHDVFSRWIYGNFYNYSKFILAATTDGKIFSGDRSRTTRLFTLGLPLTV